MVPISIYAIFMNLKAMNVIVISHFYLSEKMTLERFNLVVISFIGAFMIVKPDLISKWINQIFLRNNDPIKNDSESPSMYSNFFCLYIILKPMFFI